jgi:ComF family protein
VSQTTLAPKAKEARQPVPRAQLAARRRQNWWRGLRDALANLVYPPQCAFCSLELEDPPAGLLLCADCVRRLAPAVTRCPACALPAPNLPTPDGRCASCRLEKPAFDQARVLGSYDDQVRLAVLKIKHAWYEPLAVSLGGLLAERISQVPLPRAADLVVPVPMYWVRRAWRGTSAADSLAERLAAELSIPLARSLVRCTRWMARQSALPASERRENVRGAYAVSRRWDIRGKTILVVDDVITTAATCDEVARVLKRAGAQWVFAAAVARPVGMV